MAIQRSGRRSFLVLMGISALLMACGGSSVEKPTSEADVAKSLFNKTCAICHGEKGDQRFANAPLLTQSTLSYPEVVERITKGKGGMPPQESILSPEEIEIVAKYVMKFRENPAAP